MWHWMGMKPLIDLCDLIAQSPRVSRAQLNVVVALARFLSKCPNHTDQRPEYVVSEFLRSIPASFNQSFWPQSFGTDSIASFYADFLAYVSKATELSSDFAADVAEFIGDIVMSAVGNETGDLRIYRAFLRALSQSFLPILISDADKLVAYLLDHFVSDVPNSF
ncbi:Phosphatidylinositol 4-kinase alpha 1 [Camellia lanceoleosa]|uniref:Phosphatidylinositol 4-kinase alpha 1 n=1 Tax=Camellia lanceoleosa TaxID=1840588 RepID=A0ACC0IU48_9ERIC|nr:Phosphatidylinositol 4-kinase alpha 1 [Camellia lanceoleosa]